MANKYRSNGASQFYRIYIFFPFSFDNEAELVESLAGYHTEVKCIVSLYEFLE